LKSADNAVNGYPFPSDIGRFNKGSFVYISAFGLFTDVSYETDQKVKNVLGHLAYLLEGTKRLLKVPSYKMKVTYDDQVIEDEFVFGMITNSRSVGGFRSMIGKDVVFDDCVFEVTLIKTPKNPIELQEIMAALLIEQIDTRHMYTFRAKKILFESEEEVAWTMDGEYGGSHKEVEIENMQKALKIMVPEDYVEDLSEVKESEK
jgi:diacylglycerol kinase family enzyme